MTLWLITGLTDARWVANIARNHARLGGELVVVENGARWTGPTERVHVVQSERGVAKYMNAGLAYVREHTEPSDWVLKCDSDDYYEERFSRAILESGAQAVGCASVYIETDDGELLFADAGVAPGEVIPPHIVAHGPTLACRVGVALDFPEPDSRGFGEDILWVEAMRAQGVEFRCLPPDGFVWRRHGAERGHAFPVHGRDLLHLIPFPIRNVATGEQFVRDPERQRAVLAGLLRRETTMTKIAIPAPVPLASAGADVSAAPQMTFRDFLLVLCGRSALTKGKPGGQGILLAAKITEACECCPLDGEVEFEDAHVEALRSALNEPVAQGEGDWVPQLRFRLAPFAAALLG